MSVFKDSYFRFRLIFWLIYIIAVFGVWTRAPRYETILDNAFRIIVGIALIYYFHPWKKIRFSDFHHSLVFEAGILLILSSSIKYFLEQIPILNSLIVDEHKRQNQLDFQRQAQQAVELVRKTTDQVKMDYGADVVNTDQVGTDTLNKIKTTVEHALSLL